MTQPQQLQSKLFVMQRNVLEKRTFENVRNTAKNVDIYSSFVILTKSFVLSIMIFFFIYANSQIHQNNCSLPFSSCFKSTPKAYRSCLEFQEV